MAKAIYVHEGCEIDYTPTSDIAPGDVVVINELVAVAKRAIPAGTLGSLSVAGVFDFAKATGEGTAIAAGLDVYWDGEKSVATTEPGDRTSRRIGRSIAAGADDSTTVRVRLQQ